VRRILSVVALSLAVLGVACGGDAPPSDASRAAHGQAAPGPPSQNTASAPPGETAANTAPSGTTAAVPGDFPKDLPIYPRASVTSANATFGTTAIALSSRDGVDDVSKFYQDAFKKNGWDVLPPSEMGGYTVLTATKEKRQSSITISKDPQGSDTVIRITYIPAT
jgi:hypothetical protein